MGDRASDNKVALYESGTSIICYDKSSCAYCTQGAITDRRLVVGANGINEGSYIQRYSYMFKCPCFGGWEG